MDRDTLTLNVIEKVYQLVGVKLDKVIKIPLQINENSMSRKFILLKVGRIFLKIFFLNQLN
jgi:hypothetical protein